jgi:hypothetical protein
MPKFFRFQNSDFIGIYAGTGGFYSFDQGRVDITRHPTPTDDSALMEDYKTKFPLMGGYRGYYFNYGFTSLEQLKSWIYKNSWIVQLYKNNFRVMVYEVPDDECVIGSTQMAVTRDWFMRNFDEWSQVLKLEDLVEVSKEEVGLLGVLNTVE